MKRQNHCKNISLKFITTIVRTSKRHLSGAPSSTSYKKNLSIDIQEKVHSTLQDPPPGDQERAKKKEELLSPDSQLWIGAQPQPRAEEDESQGLGVF